MLRKFLPLLIALSLLSCQNTSDTHGNDACPPAVWPDKCAVAWLHNPTPPMPMCVVGWLDKNARLQTLLSGH